MPKYLKLDHEIIEKLAAIHCTNTEIAATLGCNSSLLSKKPYSEIIAKGKERGKQSLRRKMYETAMGGNVTMQIWLSKQYLEMKDQTNLSVEKITDEAQTKKLDELHAELRTMLLDQPKDIECSGQTLPSPSDPTSSPLESFTESSEPK